MQNVVSRRKRRSLMQTVICDRRQCYLARCRGFTGWFLTTKRGSLRANRWDCFLLLRIQRPSVSNGNNSHLNVLWRSVCVCIALTLRASYAISALLVSIFMDGYVNNYAARPSNSISKNNKNWKSDSVYGHCSRRDEQKDTELNIAHALQR